MAAIAVLPASACEPADAPALTVLSVPDRQNAAPSVAARGTEVIVASGATPAESPAQIFIEGTRRTFLVEGRGDRWSAVEPLSNGSAASYPAVAPTADGTIVVWTNHSTPYSGIAVSRRPNDH